MFEAKSDGDETVVYDKDTVLINEDGTISDPVLDSNYLSFEQIRMMIQSTASEFQISEDALYIAVKENTPLLMELWPINGKEKAYAIIEAQALRIKNSVITDSTGLTGCFTETQLKDMVIKQSSLKNVSYELVIDWLRINTDFFKTMFNYGQTELVNSYIKKGIISISEGTVTDTIIDPTYTVLTSQEIILMAQNMARETNVNSEELLGYLKLSTPLFTEQWTTDQVEKVQYIIKDAIARMTGNGTNDSTLVDPAIISSEEITAIATKLASVNNVSAEKLISYLRIGTKLYTQDWKTSQYGDIEWIINDAIVTQFLGGYDTIDNGIVDSAFVDTAYYDSSNSGSVDSTVNADGSWGITYK